MEAALGIAGNLVSSLLVAGGRIIRDEALGDDQQRVLRDVFARATAVLLVEVARSASDSPRSFEQLGERFDRFYEDRWVAETLIGAALRSEPPPFDSLRNRFDELGLEPDGLPIDFEVAMRMLTKEVTWRLREEASKADSPLHNLVEMSDLAAIRRMLEDRSLEEWSDDATSTERQDLLPPRPALVLGREDELQRVKRTLGVGPEEAGSESDSPAKKVLGLHGWPGVGKSTFISELCNDDEILEHFAGGVFFLPVGHSPEVRRLAEEICAVLEVPITPGARLDALRGRIANALSQRRVLLVFDDVWEERHVAPLLLVGGGSAALIATRRLDVAIRLSTVPDGALKLSLLSEADSLGLLRSRALGVVAGNEEACRELVRELDGLPLAVGVAADLLRVEAEGGFEVSGLITELSDAARVLGEEAPVDATAGYAVGEVDEMVPTVRVLLQKSLERLDENLVRGFARLGVLPSKPLSFDPWTAFDMWRDTSEDPDAENGTTEEEQWQARDALRELVRRGLVDSAGGGVDPLAVRLNLRTKRPERFWMHALVAAFALETLERTEGEDGVREAQQRRLEHYRRVVRAVSASSHGSEEIQLFGVNLMALDLPNIRAAHDWARSHSLDDRRALEYLSHLLSQSPHVLSMHLTSDEFLEWVRLAEEAARRIGDSEAGTDHRRNLGAALLKNGLMEKALPYCEESVQEARRSGDAAAEAAALANLSAIYSWRGDDEAALIHARMAEDAARRGGDTDMQAAALGRQARVLTSLGRPAEAERRLEDKRDLAQEKGRLYRYAEALRDLAHIKRDRPEERDEARRMYEEAAAIFWDHRQYDDYRRALNGLGILEDEAGMFDAAKAAYERALSSALEDGNEDDQARAKMHLGIVHRHQGAEGDVEAAETEFREALPLAARSENIEQVGNLLLNLAYLLYQDKGDKLEARKAAEAAAAYANVQSEMEAQARELIAAIDSANG